MYVTYIQGVPEDWGRQADMLHYTSPDLLKWTYQSKLHISEQSIIDACIYQLPSGIFRMWFKENNHTYAAESKDLYHWDRVGIVIAGRGHEGPNVFHFKNCYWMIVDEWRGQGVYRSDDLMNWEPKGLILDKPGSREDDGTIGLHADVIVQGEEAYIFYFTHPGRINGIETSSYETKRSSIQVARLDVIDGFLTCNRDEDFELELKPED